MAVITVNEEDLYNLLGVKLTRKNLIYWLAMQGTPIEREHESELDIEVFPNRPDMLSVEGLARNLRGLLNIERGLPNYTVERGYVQVKVGEGMAEVRPYIAAGVVRDLELTDNFVKQIMQIQEKIHDTHGRKRRKVAIGLHDLDKVEPPFSYIPADPEQYSFTPLHEEREMTLKQILKENEKGRTYGYILAGKEKYPLIIDKMDRVLSFPPIINSTLTEVTEKTTNLFIDVTGTSFRAVNKALNILCTMFAERGATIESVEVIYPKASKWLPNLTPEKVTLNVNYVQKILGVTLSKEEIIKLLLKSRFGVERVTENHIEVLVPAYRTDIMHQIDIVEDLAITYGYDKFQLRIPKIFTSPQRNRQIEKINELRRLMTGMGFIECLTFLQSSSETLTAKMLLPKRKLVEIENPVSLEYNVLRDTLLPSLLEVLKYNKRYEYPQKIFEIGYVIKPDEGAETGVSEEINIAYLISSPETTYTDAKAVLETLSQILNKRWEVKEKNRPPFLEGRTAEILEGEKSIGYLGEIHPQVLENFELTQPVSAAEIYLTKTLTV